MPRLVTLIIYLYLFLHLLIYQLPTNLGHFKRYNLPHDKRIFDPVCQETAELATANVSLPSQMLYTTSARQQKNSLCNDSGEPLMLLMETYNDMIKFSLIPTIRTCTFLVQALTHRDFEVQEVIEVMIGSPSSGSWSSSSMDVPQPPHQCPRQFGHWNSSAILAAICSHKVNCQRQSALVPWHGVS